MTDALSPTVPAGWYPDPWGSTSQRWWDGTSWTDNLYPQPQAPTNDHATDAPAMVAAQAPEDSPSPEDDYVPSAVRSTYEPATSYRDAAAPTSNSPYPSRRALRELATTAQDAHAAVATEDAPMDQQAHETPPIVGGLPAFTQAPEFSPEPVSALAPPVWKDSEEPAETAAVVEVAEPEVQPPTFEVTAVEVTAVETTAAEVTAIETPPTAAEPAAAAAAFEPFRAASVATADDVDDEWAASLARWEDAEATSAPPDALPIFGDSPPVSYSQRAMKYQPMHGRTSPVWLIVFMPIVQAVSIVGSLYLFPGIAQFNADLFAVAPTEAATMELLVGLRDWFLFAALPLSIAFFVFTFIMGFQDRARLRLLGHDQTASPWWIVLSPLVYLIVRGVRVRQCTGRRGSGPLTTYICLYIAPAIALIVARAVTTALYGAIPA